jgi:hypothetical protein
LRLAMGHPFVRLIRSDAARSWPGTTTPDGAAYLDSFR